MLCDPARTMLLCRLVPSGYQSDIFPSTMTILSTIGPRLLPGGALLLIPVLLQAQTVVTEYKGVMGGSIPITMSLQKKVERIDDGGRMVEVTRYSGSYWYDSHAGKPIHLSGSITRYNDQPDDPFGVIQIEEEADGNRTGIFSGQITSGGVFTGNWNNPEYTKRSPFILYPVSSGGAGAARRDLEDLSIFWKEFQALVKKDQKEGIADKTFFPLPGSGYVLGRWDRGLDRKEFLKNYKKIFGPEAKRTVENTGLAEMYPSVASSENLWGLPGGTVLYFMVFDSERGGEQGAPAVGFGFGKVDGAYRLLVIEVG